VSRQVQLVLLCEDRQHEAFVRRFLKAMGWETRAMRVERTPGGRVRVRPYLENRDKVDRLVIPSLDNKSPLRCVLRPLRPRLVKLKLICSAAREIRIISH
jgi:hypothetical protein